MNYKIKEDSKKPAYLQLYDYIRRDITSDVYPYGTKLPSKRQYAAETQLSVITVEHAIDLLCEEGYVEAKERSGYYVIYKISDFAISNKKNSSYKNQEKTESLKNKMPLSAKKESVKQGLPVKSEQARPEVVKTIFPFSVISKNMRKVLLDNGTQILERSPNQGIEQLREEICSYLLRSAGIEVGKNQIVIGSGAEYLYGLIAQMFSDYKTFAIEDPSYSKIEDVYRALGIKCKRLKLRADGISSEDLSAAEAKILHVTPFNSFPSGISVSISKKYEYLSWANSKGGFIIEDNYDSELTVYKKAEETLYSMSQNSDVIYINTFSRTIAPSLRVGYMLLPEKLLTVFNEKLGFYSCTVPVFEQYVIASLLKSGDYERHINRVRRNRRRAMEQL